MTILLIIFLIIFVTALVIIFKSYRFIFKNKIPHKLIKILDKYAK